MESIALILKQKKEIKLPKYQWQELAFNIIKFLYDGEKKKSSIFLCCKKNEKLARYAFNECKELNKPYTNYFLKIFNNCG